MPNPRTDVAAEHFAIELRKIADSLRALADKIESEERNRQLLHPRRAIRGGRQNRYSQRAGALLMDTLELGGPNDESLKVILESWRDGKAARGQCFLHVCSVWRRLPESSVRPSAAILMTWAAAIRVMAAGVSSDRS